MPAKQYDHLREGHMFGKALAGLTAIAIGSCFSAAQAQDIKMYVFSSGALTIGKGALVNGASDTPPIPRIMSPKAPSMASPASAGPRRSSEKTAAFATPASN